MRTMTDDEADSSDQAGPAGAPTPDDAEDMTDNGADEAAEGEAPMAPGELCVPLAALAQPDEQEQMQPPAPGDKATAQIDYTVTRVEGDNAYITLDGVNGQPINNGSPSDQAAPGTGPADLAQLKQQAAAMPNY